MKIGNPKTTTAQPIGGMSATTARSSANQPTHTGSARTRIAASPIARKKPTSIISAPKKNASPRLPIASAAPDSSSPLELVARERAGQVGQQGREHEERHGEPEEEAEPSELVGEPRQTWTRSPSRNQTRAIVPSPQMISATARVPSAPSK